MPDFMGTKSIVLQPLHKNVTYEFEITVASAVGEDDGFLPHNSTISSVDVKIFDNEGAENTEILQDTDLTGFVVTLTLTYPPVAGEGYYGVRFVVKLVDGQEIEADFARIQCINRGLG